MEGLNLDNRTVELLELLQPVMPIPYNHSTVDRVAFLTGNVKLKYASPTIAA